MNTNNRYIYIVQPIEHIDKNIYIVSDELPRPHNTIIFSYKCFNHDKTMKYVHDILLMNIINRTDLGPFYYQGDIKDILRCINIAFNCDLSNNYDKSEDIADIYSINSIFKFIIQKTRPNENSIVLMTSLFKQYSMFCFCNDFMQCSYKKFGTELYKVKQLINDDNIIKFDTYKCQKRIEPFYKKNVCDGLSIIDPIIVRTNGIASRMELAQN